MHDIRTSAEVADMPGDLHRLRRSPAYGPFTRWHCRGPDDTNTELATVIAELYEGTARATLAHAECARSQVVSTGALAPAALSEPGQARTWPR